MLSEDSNHIWKPMFGAVSRYSEVDDAVVDENNYFQRDSLHAVKWKTYDIMTRATIGLSGSVDLPEHVCKCKTARRILVNIKKGFHRHTLLNKLWVLRGLYTVQMNWNGKMLSYISRVQHLGSVLRSTGVDVDNKEMATAIWNGLPSLFEGLVTTLDAFRHDEILFTFELVKSRCYGKIREQKFVWKLNWNCFGWCFQTSSTWFFECCFQLLAL